MTDIDITRNGKGSAFSVPPPAGESRSPVPPRSARVLVMDDEAAIRLLAERVLARGGHTVATAPDAAQAIAQYKQAMEEGHPFDVVIMELISPGGPGGRQTVQDLLAIDPLARAIVCSGFTENPVMADPTAYGFKAAVPKPYSVSALCEAVARVLA